MISHTTAAQLSFQFDSFSQIHCEIKTCDIYKHILSNIGGQNHKKTLLEGSVRVVGRGGERKIEMCRYHFLFLTSFSGYRPWSSYWISQANFPIPLKRVFTLGGTSFCNFFPTTSNLSFSQIYFLQLCFVEGPLDRLVARFFQFEHWGKWRPISRPRKHLFC